MKHVILALTGLFLVIPCYADIIIVDDDWPADFNNIQAAIDYSTGGDIIYVFPGTYIGPGNYSISFDGKAVTVQSVDPLDPYVVAATVIDCNGFGPSVLDFHSGEDANSVLAGLTMTNAYGAIRCWASSPTVAYCALVGNSGAYGGGVYCRDSNAIIINCTITGNSASKMAGGIYCENSSPTITNCTISQNSGYTDAGGIYCHYNSSPVITNCTITDNTVINGRGGGVSCVNDSSPTITDCDISRNTSSDEGGGIHCAESSPTIINCNISHNAAAEGGGGIYCRESSSLTINNCKIIGNSTNSAVYSGGGIYCDGGNLTINDSVMSANTGEFGGAIYCSETTLKITGSTIAANAATVETGGVHSISGMIYLTDCVLWGNNDSGPTDLSAQIDASEPPKVVYSCIQDDNPGDGNVPFGAGDPNYNIDDDPRFVRDPNDGGDGWGVGGNDDFGDLHLEANSPCIEAGLPNYIAGPNVFDIDGQPRVIGRQIDIGADEYAKIIIVTKPQGGEVWATESTHRINWESYGVAGNLDITCLDNNGSTFLPIDENVPDTGTYTWSLPNSVDSNQCQVLVYPHDINLSIVTVDSGLFTIKPYSPGPPIAAKWKSLGGDFNRSGLSDQYGPEIGCIKWQFQTAGAVHASPTVADNNTVHIACEDGNLYTLDANDGSLLWSCEADSPLLSAPTIGPDGTVYVGAQNGKLHAVDVNGLLRWTHTTDGLIYSSPAVSPDGNSVYVCSEDGSLYALGRDGSELWTFQTAGPGIATGAIFGSPAVGPDGTVYVAGVYDANLYALDPDTGAVLWDCNFLDPCDPNSEAPWLFTSPVIVREDSLCQALLYNPKREFGGQLGDRDYQLVYDAKLYNIDANDGSILWTTNVSDTQSYPNEPDEIEPDWFRPYYTEAYGEDYHIPPYPYKQTGRTQVRYYRVSKDCWSEPAVGPDETIYVSFDDQYLRALDPNGTIKWAKSLGWVGSFTLTVGADGLIYAASDDGYLYVVDPNGNEIARYRSGSYLSHPVITHDGTIIVADANNMVTAIVYDDCPGQSPALHRPEDLNTDWQMNFLDFGVLAADWLDCSDTSLEPYEDGPICDYDGNDIFLTGDINRDQYVDLFDLAQLTFRWLVQE